MRVISNLAVFGLAIIISHCYAQTQALVEITNIADKDIKVECFKLNQNQDIKIEAVGFRGGNQDKWMFTRSWILDARTRELVWEMNSSEPKKESHRLLIFEDNVAFPEGEYEVYYSTYPYHHSKDWGGFNNFFSKFWKKLDDEEEHDDIFRSYKEQLHEFKITIIGQGKRYSTSEIGTLREPFLKNSIISMIGLHDDQNLQKGFHLNKPIDMEVYAIGEIREDGSFDYGWIIDAHTQKKIWNLDYSNSIPAGGAAKNRMTKDTINLPKGNYVVFFMTDDSHSTNNWNMAPPNDPDFWGITLKVSDPEMKKYVSSYDYKNIDEEYVVAKLTKLKNNEFLAKEFTCKKDLNLRIYALGEGKPGQMYDYAWIVDAKTHKKIWQMDYYNTEHAGGGQKNRLFNDMIKLNKGNYIVYCVSDDNHSYWDWNTAPPYDQENWGVTILAADSNYENGDVVEYSDIKNGKVITALVGIGDYERRRKNFELAQDKEVQIYALGEGTKGRMFDYGWIENQETGKVVWEMEYDDTEYAGGAYKNRFFDGNVFLKKGKYTVYFVTDDSHSSKNWNMKPPFDPANWGITIYEAN